MCLYRRRVLSAKRRYRFGGTCRHAIAGYPPVRGKRASGRRDTCAVCSGSNVRFRRMSSPGKSVYRVSHCRGQSNRCTFVTVRPHGPYTYGRGTVPLIKYRTTCANYAFKRFFPDERPTGRRNDIILRARGRRAAPCFMIRENSLCESCEITPRTRW